MQTSHQLSYRPDVDGLRAIAVLAVVLYHAGLSCPGGFVGVDVFFVISGYLITSLIIKDLRNGEFSFAGFWERRARRILPALFVVTAATLVAGYFLCLPDEFANIGRATVAMTLMGANVFFWRNANNYFDDSMSGNPLLHTWSLAVEEQFYFVIPAVLFWAYRLRSPDSRSAGTLWRHLPSVLLLVFVASFGLSIYGTYRFAGAAFYLLPMRAWELLAGSLLAFLPACACSRGLRESSALVGLATILAPVFLYDASTRFPGLAAFPPCLGAALIIWSGTGADNSRSLVARFLSLRWVVFVGLISYSLYLWHWPILAFYKTVTLLTVETEPAVVKGTLVGLSLMLATLSWRFVERPFRKRSAAGERPIVWKVSLASLMLLLVSGATVANVPMGYLAAAEDKVRVALAARRMISKGWEVGPSDLEQGNVPEFGASSKKGRPSILIWGDSHAFSITPAVDQLLIEQEESGRIITYRATPPLVGWSKSLEFEVPNGTKGWGEATMDLVAQEQLSVVILAAYWPYYIRNHGPDEIGQRLIETVSQIVKAGAEPWVILDVPEANGDVPRSLARSAMFPRLFGKPELRKRITDVPEFDGFQPETIAALEKLGARIINPKPQFVDDDGEHYFVEQEEYVAYRDSDHISATCAKELILPLLREEWQKRELRIRERAEGPAAKDD